jgi:hypothetical protein
MKRYLFNPGIDSPLRYVHPIQVKSIANFLSDPFPDYINRIILFGGSLDLACGMDSDLDLYIISEHDPDVVYKEMHDRCKKLGKPFDILVSPYEDYIAESMEFGTTEYEVAREGLCLYAKA